MMKRTTVDGKVVNRRTAEMLALWEFNALTDLFVVQGSYNAGGVPQSKGTHDGGGAIDVSTHGLGSTEDKKWIVKQGRLAGWMAYLRPTIPNLWNEHIHAGALGDPEASDGLKDQFKEYRAGGDGLKGNAPDPDPRVRIRVWPKVRYKKVSLLVAYRQFKAKNPEPRMTVKRIQWVLNERLGLDLVVDGIAGPVTREAYKQWEIEIGSKRPNSVPGQYSLNALGEGRFKVNLVTFEKMVQARKLRAAQREEEKKNPTFSRK